MNPESLFLRALEPKDLDLLFEIENEDEFWKYANRTEPYSKDLLNSYIKQQHQDIFEVKQKRFVLSDGSSSALGFVDLFDFEPLHRRAGVCIVIRKRKRGLGYGKKGLELLDSHCKINLNIHCLFANIATENKTSLHIFERCGYQKVGVKKEWNFYEGSFHDEFLYQKLFI